MPSELAQCNLRLRNGWPPLSVVWPCGDVEALLENQDRGLTDIVDHVEHRSTNCIPGSPVLKIKRPATVFDFLGNHHCNAICPSAAADARCVGCDIVWRWHDCRRRVEVAMSTNVVISPSLLKRRRRSRRRAAVVVGPVALARTASIEHTITFS